MRKLMACLVALVATAAANAAPIVYNNGGPNQVNGNEMTAWIQAEDFTLTEATNLTAARFWAIEQPNAYQGSIVWQIYSNNAGQPGTLLHSGTTTPTRTATGNSVFFGDEFQYDFALAATLEPGTYWLGLHNGPLSTTFRAEFYWETTGLNGTNTGTTRGNEDGAPFGVGGWFNNGQEHAFFLEGTPAAVPEPISLVVFGGLVLGGGLVARKRLAKKAVA